MIALRITLALLAASCATWSTTGSIYRSPCTHVGVRPVADGEIVGATVRVSSNGIGCGR